MPTTANLPLTGLGTSAAAQEEPAALAANKRLRLQSDIKRLQNQRDKAGGVKKTCEMLSQRAAFLRSGKLLVAQLDHSSEKAVEYVGEEEVQA